MKLRDTLPSLLVAAALHCAAVGQGGVRGYLTLAPLVRCSVPRHQGRLEEGDWHRRGPAALRILQKAGGPPDVGSGPAGPPHADGCSLRKLPMPRIHMLAVSSVYGLP